MKVTLRINDNEEPDEELQEWLDECGEILTGVMNDPIMVKIDTIGEPYIKQMLEDCSTIEELKTFLKRLTHE